MAQPRWYAPQCRTMRLSGPWVDLASMRQRGYIATDFDYFDKNHFTELGYFVNDNRRHKPAWFKNWAANPVGEQRRLCVVNLTELNQVIVACLQAGSEPPRMRFPDPTIDKPQKLQPPHPPADGRPVGVGFRVNGVKWIDPDVSIKLNVPLHYGRFDRDTRRDGYYIEDDLVINHRGRRVVVRKGPLASSSGYMNANDIEVDGFGLSASPTIKRDHGTYSAAQQDASLDELIRIADGKAAAEARYQEAEAKYQEAEREREKRRRAGDAGGSAARSARPRLEQWWEARCNPRLRRNDIEYLREQIGEFSLQEFDQADIKKRYREWFMQNHPDKIRQKTGQAASEEQIARSQKVSSVYGDISRRCK